jgi:hypothetical protein
VDASRRFLWVRADRPRQRARGGPAGAIAPEQRLAALDGLEARERELGGRGDPVERNAAQRSLAREPGAEAVARFAPDYSSTAR